MKKGSLILPFDQTTKRVGKRPSDHTAERVGKRLQAGLVVLQEEREAKKAEHRSPTSCGCTEGSGLDVYK